MTATHAMGKTTMDNMLTVKVYKTGNVKVTAEGRMASALLGKLYPMHEGPVWMRAHELTTLCAAARESIPAIKFAIRSC